MKHFFLFLLSSLLLGAGPAWAMNPIGGIVIANGETTTLNAGVSGGNPDFGGGRPRYYDAVEILSGGRGIVTDRQHVQALTVRSGGILEVRAAGSVNSPLFQPFGAPRNATVVLEAGARLELATPSGLPFGVGRLTDEESGGDAYDFTISPDVFYTFNGEVAQSSAAPAPTPFGDSGESNSNGIALPPTVGRLTVNNAAGYTLANNTGVSQEIHLRNGELTVASGATLTLLSTASGTALLDTRPGTNPDTEEDFASSLNVLGQFAVQRYIDGSLNDGVGYRHLGAPVQGATIVSFSTPSFTPFVNSIFNTDPTAITVESLFPNVFSYDQSRVGQAGVPGPVGFSQGWVSPLALSDAAEPGTGYTVRMPSSTTITFTGAPQLEPVFVNGSERGSNAAAGWNLFANPFAGPIDWQSMVLSEAVTGSDGSLYVFKSSGPYTGSYSSYVPYNGGQGVNGGTNVVPLGQAFFTRTFNEGASTNIFFSPFAVIDSYDDTNNVKLQRGDGRTSPSLKLALRNAAGTQAHETLVYFDAAATAGRDAKYDATYLAGPGQALALTTESAGEAFSINGLPAFSGADVTVPLRLRAATAGTYTLSTLSLRNLPAGYHAYLRDAVTGARTDLSATPNVSVTLAANTTVSGRYSVLFSTAAAPLASAPAALAALVSVYPNPAHGTATLRLPVALRGGQATPVALLNSLGQTVRTATHTAAAQELELSLSGLAPGVYTVQVRAAAGTVSRRLVVE